MNDFPQDKGREFCNQHVYANQTMLVVDLAELEYSSRGDLAYEFSLSQNCINYSEPAGFEEWGATECIAWLRANDVDEEEWPDDWTDWSEMEDDEKDNIWDNDIDGFSDDSQWRECMLENWKKPEIYAWYVVSDWFEYQLEMIGEVILKNAYGEWWGRQACGQAIYMDEYLHPIFEKWFRED